MDISQILIFFEPFLTDDESENSSEEESEEEILVSLINRFICTDPLSVSVKFLAENPDFIETLESLVSSAEALDVNFDTAKSIIQTCLIGIPKLNASVEVKDVLI